MAAPRQFTTPQREQVYRDSLEEAVITGYIVDAATYDEVEGRLVQEYPVSNEVRLTEWYRNKNRYFVPQPGEAMEEQVVEGAMQEEEEDEDTAYIAGIDAAIRTGAITDMNSFYAVEAAIARTTGASDQARRSKATWYDNVLKEARRPPTPHQSRTPPKPPSSLKRSYEPGASAARSAAEEAQAAAEQAAAEADRAQETQQAAAPGLRLPQGFALEVRVAPATRNKPAGPPQYYVPKEHMPWVRTALKIPQARKTHLPALRALLTQLGVANADKALFGSGAMDEDAMEEEDNKGGSDQDTEHVSPEKRRRFDQIYGKLG